MTTRRWDGVGIGREAQEGGDICTPVADSWCRMQKPTQYCKAIILQLKISRFLKKEISQKSSSFKKKKSYFVDEDLQILQLGHRAWRQETKKSIFILPLKTLKTLSLSSSPPTSFHLQVMMESREKEV